MVLLKRPKPKTKNADPENETPEETKEEDNENGGNEA